MISLRNRSYQKELLDNDDIPFADIRQNMKELNTVNKWLGGHKITISGVQSLIKNYKFNKPLTICEIGCGGGDNLKAIHNYCIGKNIPVSFIGIDIKTECIEFARQQYPELNSTWITNDYRETGFGDQKPDIIFSSLFCHHFSKADLKTMLHWMQQNSTTGFFINDLQRHWIAYYSIKWITRLFSRSYLVKNDAPLSVARGFTKNEWIEIFRSAGMRNFSIQWKWAFRYLITCRHD
jgi:2-polyprenyl-3-methyl-5-hydroxy-6-metoxy-1,4-benzoquinol methylase